MAKKLMKISALILVAFLLGGAAVAGQQGVSLWDGLRGNQPQQAANKSSDTVPAALSLPSEVMNVADLVDKVSPAVVNIRTQVQVNARPDNPFFNDPFFRQFFGDEFNFRSSPRYETGIGTGFLISADGYILTNQHVIDHAAQVTVQLNGQKKEVPARVVGQDRDLDLAVLKIEGSDYPTLTLGSSDRMRVGDWVVAIGQPYGLDHTVTIGVVSAKGRPISIEDREYKNLIQTDAAINPGNSGGPLLNLKGEVIGINTAVNAQAQGIGFAIPTNTVSQVLKDLKNGDKVIHPFLGIRMTDVNQEIRQELRLPQDTQGVVVVEVIAGTAAAQAGLIYGDVIVAINDQKIESAEDLQQIISRNKVGARLSVQLIRQGNSLTLPVILQPKP